MRNKIIIAILFILATLGTVATAQINNAGIRFVKGLTWSQILAKAKTEHKYIFVDCYATWCGPCKQMEQSVYPQKEVGDTYNNKFICVRVQMDRTETDNDTIKTWYPAAKMLQKNYNVNAYPTFLFFDENGKPVHKVSGSMSIKKFVQLAQDAQNSAKQYYAVLADFKPGKLDTAEERSLALSFAYSDTLLAGRLVLDYLKRVPSNILSSKNGYQLMITFSKNQQDLYFIASYLEHLPKWSFAKKENLDFVARLKSRPEIHEIAVRYIMDLNKKAFAEPGNLSFTEGFNIDPGIKAKAKQYIDDLTEPQLYSKANLEFLSAFTFSTMDRGFNIFYRQGDRVDAFLGKGSALDIVKNIVRREEFTPLFNAAKATGNAPDFVDVYNVVANKYDAGLATFIRMDAKLTWYKYLVYIKKDESFWSDLIDARIEEVNTLGLDTDKSPFIVLFINNNVYYETFLHSDKPEQLEAAIGWMKNIVGRNPDRFDCMDTYADVLYKAGKTGQAIAWEEKAYHAALEHKNQKEANFFAKSIEKMRGGERIWMQKPYTQF